MVVPETTTAGIDLNNEVIIAKISSAISDIRIYVFSEAGTYLGLTSLTDSLGETFFDLSKGSYKFRADYNGVQYWSNRNNFV